MRKKGWGFINDVLPAIAHSLYADADADAGAGAGAKSKYGWH